MRLLPGQRASLVLAEMVLSSHVVSFFCLARVFSGHWRALAASIRAPLISVPSLSFLPSLYLSVRLLTFPGASGDSSDTPRWVYRLVSLFQPNSILLKHPNLARHEAARQAAIKAKAGVPAPAVTSGDDKSKGKGKAVAGPSTPGKKRAAEESSAEKEKAGKRKKKKKKKTKETPEPPRRVDATPRSGPVFDSVLYQTPLDWPMVYRAENEHWFMDVFERLREVRARTSHDYDAMRAVAISKGWWSQEDETSEEETDSGSSASTDILNKAK